jgi:RNA polymerase sigma factor for flagellar operon FliA
VPRSVRAKTRHIERAQVRLETRLGHTPSDSEISQEMQVSVQELRQIHSRAAHTSVGSIDELGGVEDIATVTSVLLEDQETRAALRHAIRDLRERDRIIVALYYFEGLTLSEVGQVLGVTESRVSQLHSRIAVALRDNLTPSAAA